MNDEKYMRMAIAAAREGMRNGQTPFGACIVKDGDVLSCVHNVVWNTTDVTAHAEVAAIRQTCRKLQTIDLSETILYSTCEPCPMCFTACHWARISKIVFGTRIQDAQDAGFNELNISNKKLKDLSQSPVELVGNFLRDECLTVFQEWSQMSAKRTY